MNEITNIKGNQILSFLHPAASDSDKPAFRVSGDGIALSGTDTEADGRSDALQKHADAKKRAMKVVSDTLKSESKLDDELFDVQKQNDALLKTFESELRAADADNSHISELKELAGVDDDSDEQKELLLLMRDLDDPSHSTFSRDEITKLGELRKKREAGELTMYQENAISTYESQKEHERAAKNAEDEFHANTAGLRAAAIDRLKSAPMLTAVKEKDILMDAADGALISDLMSEAKEHIDEEHEKDEERAEKIKEKREELEERVEKLREDNAATEKILESITDPDTLKDKISQEIEKLLDELSLTAEDISGAAIDKRI